MKTGTTLSTWRYDALTGQALQSAKLRLAIATLRPKGGILLISCVVRLCFDSGPLDESLARREGPISDISRSPRRLLREASAE